MRAAQGEPIAIAPTAMKYLKDSYNLVMTAARAVEIYGLTVDMSLNKDHHLFFMKGTEPQRAEPPALKICIKKLLPKGNQSSDKRTIKRSKDLQR